MKLNQEKPKQLHTQTHHNQTAKNEKQKENYKSIRENQHITFKETDFEWLYLSHQKAWRPESNATTFLNWWRKDLLTKNSVDSENILWIQNEIKTFPRERKLKQFVVSRFAHKELWTKVFQTKGKWYQKETWNIKNQGRATEMVNKLRDVIDYSFLLNF